MEGGDSYVAGIVSRLTDMDHVDTLDGAAAILALQAEVARLRAWKSEAHEVLIGWHDLTEEVFAALGQPAHLLGKRGVDVVRAALESS